MEGTRAIREMRDRIVKVACILTAGRRSCRVLMEVKLLWERRPKRTRRWKCDGKQLRLNAAANQKLSSECI